MAISYGAKLFESEVTTKTTAHTIGAAVKAGALVCIAITGKRSGAYFNISSISDSAGNTWDWKIFQSQYRACAVAWARTSVALTTSDTITVTLSGTPTYCWKSAHSFEGADGTPISEATGSGSSTTASAVVTVSGSDWLSFGAVMLPDATSGGLTALNSATSRDDNGHSGTTPWAECSSRNGTSGTSYTHGFTLPSSQQWACCAVSFPYLAMPSSPVRAVSGPIGI